MVQLLRDAVGIDSCHSAARHAIPRLLQLIYEHCASDYWTKKAHAARMRNEVCWSISSLRDFALIASENTSMGVATMGQSCNDADIRQRGITLHQRPRLGVMRKAPTEHVSRLSLGVQHEHVASADATSATVH